MNHTILAAALIAFASIANAATTPNTDAPQHRSEAYQQRSGNITADTTPDNTNTDNRKLPGRDCKLYEGSTRQHSSPQYEIGNPNRPECPSA